MTGAGILCAGFLLVLAIVFWFEAIEGRDDDQ